jgi:sensor histidine kinase regulating citrate/malate metabolism
MQQEIHKLNSELDGYKQFIKNYRDLEESFENNLKVI